MFGYILAAIFGLLLLGLALAFLGGARSRGPEKGHRLGEAQPAADEPTPDRSVTATRREMETARKHTPPA
jgi:hypothetical protein